MKFLIEIEYPDGRTQESEYTLEELTRPNGSDPFIVWMLKELDEQGVEKVKIQTVKDAEGLPGYVEVDW